MSAQGNAGRGAAGEDIAEKYLEKHGYRVIARNYSIARGEIDIAAYRRGTVVIAEVKTRSGYRFGRAAEAVDEVKQQRIRRAADAFLSATPCAEGYPCTAGCSDGRSAANIPA